MPAPVIRSTRNATLLALFACLALTGCIESAEPILTGAKPVFGERFKAQLYTLKDGRADEPVLENFSWDGKRYVSSNDKPTVEPFTAHPFGSGGYIVQIVSAKQAKAEYALLHRLADGVYFGRVIDQDDADETTRKRECEPPDKFNCHIKAYKQLEIFAKATAAKNHQTGGLVILLADESTKK
jgi:hypothetical protein